MPYSSSQNGPEMLFGSSEPHVTESVANAAIDSAIEPAVSSAAASATVALENAVSSEIHKLKTTLDSFVVPEVFVGAIVPRASATSDTTTAPSMSAATPLEKLVDHVNSATASLEAQLSDSDVPSTVTPSERATPATTAAFTSAATHNAAAPAPSTAAPARARRSKLFAWLDAMGRMSTYSEPDLTAMM